MNSAFEILCRRIMLGGLHCESVCIRNEAMLAPQEIF